MTKHKKPDPGWVKFYLKGASAGDWWLKELSNQNYEDLQNLARSNVISGDDKKSIQQIARKAKKLKQGYIEKYYCGKCYHYHKKYSKNRRPYHIYLNHLKYKREKQKDVKFSTKKKNNTIFIKKK